jgi:membrane associated rhomboid family serine protease
MYVNFSDTRRMHVRPLWQAFLLSMATGSLYQVWWLGRTAYELEGAGASTRARVAAWPLGMLGAAALVLWAAVASPGPDQQAAAMVIGGALAVGLGLDLGRTIGSFQDRAGVAPTEWYRVKPAFAVGLLVIALGIGVAGVQPGDPEIAGVLDPLERAINAWATGLLLPIWLLYLQHGLNQALMLLGPVTHAEDHFGTLGGSAEEAERIRARLAIHHRSHQASEQLEDMPWVTASVAAICTAVFTWQVAMHGFSLSLDDMRASGASTNELVLDGEWWRLATQHLVHFSVDHWAFNMFALLLGGWLLERVVGHRLMAGVVLASAVGATLLTWFLGPALYGPMAAEVVSGGESGIGFGVIGALVAVDHHATTPAGKFGRWMAVIGLVSSLAPGVGLLAHAGGFLGGAAVVLLARLLVPVRPDVSIERVSSAPPVRPLTQSLPLPPVAMPPSIPPPAAAPVVPPVVPPPFTRPPWQ